MIPIVQVDRDRKFTSPTLQQQSLERLAAVFLASPFWRDAWSNRGFRAAARDLLRKHAGLVLIGPHVPIAVCPPFNEMFEPIEIGATFGGNRAQLKTLSGDAPTRQERRAWMAWIAIGLAILFMLTPFVLFFLRGMPARASIVLMSIIGMTALIPAIALGLRRRTGRWFLVPGAIAIVRRPLRKGLDPRITVLSRADTCLVFRLMNTGKATILTLELWTHVGKQFRRAISDRQALSILAAWQSSHPAPSDERLKELTW